MKKVLISIAALFVWSTSANAAGFEQANHSAAAAGVANAYAATAADASALAYNPAGIAWQSGISLTGTAYLNYRDSSVKLPQGIAPNEGSEPFAGTIFASWTPHDGRLSAGIGYSPLYYANNDWRVGFPASSGLTKLAVDRVTADLVYALSSNMAIGFGGDWYLTRVNLSRTGAAFSGNDFTAFGGHVSMMWKPRTAWSIGAMFRSGATVNISGSNSAMSFKLPDTAVIGIAHDFADTLKLETDLKWSRWSAMKGMHVSGATTMNNALNLNDTFSVLAGLTWSWRENTQLRAGYGYEQGANKSAGFNPMIADQDGHRITIGAGGDVYGVHLDIAYQYMFFPKSAATGAYAGTYRDRRQSLLLSVSKLIE